MQELLNNFSATFLFEAVYNPARGSITIAANSEDMLEKSFIIPTDFGIITWMSNPDYPWKNREGIVQAVDTDNLQSVNGVLRNTDNEFIPVSPQSDF